MFNKEVYVFGVLFRVDGIFHKPENINFIGKNSDKYNRYRNRLGKIHDYLRKYVTEELMEDENIVLYPIVNQYFRGDDYHILFSVNGSTIRLIVKENGEIELPNIRDMRLKNELVVSCLKQRYGVSNEKIDVEVLQDLNQFLPFYIIFSPHRKYSSLYRDGYSAIRRSFDDGIIRFGLELEIDSDDAYDDILFCKAIKQFIDKHNLLFQSDSSVSFGELKTYPLMYEQAVDVLKDFELIRSVFSYAFESNRAGFHIHFSCYSENQREAAYQISRRLEQIMQPQEYNEFFGRHPNTYAKVNCDKYERRRYINLTNDVTIEVRIPTTANSCRSLLDVLEFVKMFAKFTTTSNSAKDYINSTTQLKEFIEQKIEKQENVLVSA